MRPVEVWSISHRLQLWLRGQKAEKQGRSFPPSHRLGGNPNLSRPIRPAGRLSPVLRTDETGCVSELWTHTEDMVQRKDLRTSWFTRVDKHLLHSKALDPRTWL